MSQMKELYLKVAADRSLQEKLAESMNSVKEASQAEQDVKLSAFAKETGYDITIEEMQKFFLNLAEKQEAALTESELDVVAGGKSSHEPSPLEMSMIIVTQHGGFCFG